jgi:hypothetical protein
LYWDEPRLAVVVDLNTDEHDPLDRLDLAELDSRPPDITRSGPGGA